MCKLVVLAVVWLLASLPAMYVGIVLGDLVGNLFPSIGDKVISTLKVKEAVGAFAWFVIGFIAFWVVVIFNLAMATGDWWSRLAALVTSGVMVGYVFTPIASTGYWPQDWPLWSWSLVAVGWGAYLTFSFFELKYRYDTLPGN
jgi:hypothetical protein